MLRRAGILLTVATALAAVAAPLLAPNPVDRRFPRLLSAPPTIPHIHDETGWHPPFIYPWLVTSQLEQLYEPDHTRLVPLEWFAHGHLVQSSDDNAPLLILGTDSLGRDVWSRLLFGARTSLALSLTAAIAATLIGLAIGGAAGYAGGATDDLLMRATDFVMVLPAMYVALSLRAVLPLVLPPAVVFRWLVVIFAILGAPFTARGVRAIVRTERGLDYSVAAQALGASPLRLLLRHLLPAASGFVSVEITMLVPAFVVAEATLSYVGLGFPDAVPSWGTMLHDASSVRSFVDFPWLLSPGVAMFVVVLGLNLALQRNVEGVHAEAAPGQRWA